MAWSLSDALLLIGAFLVALLPVALYGMWRRPSDPHDSAAARRYRDRSQSDDERSD